MKKLLLIGLITLLSGCSDSKGDVKGFETGARWVFFSIRHPSGGLIRCVGADPGSKYAIMPCDWTGVK